MDARKKQFMERLGSSDQNFVELLKAKLRLDDIGPVSFLPVRITKSGVYHIIFNGTAVILCHNSQNNATGFIKVVCKRKTTSGPSSYALSLHLLKLTEESVKFELSDGQDPELTVHLSSPESSTPFLEKSHSVDYRGRPLRSKSDSNYEIVKDIFPEEFYSACESQLAKLFRQNTEIIEDPIDTFKKTFNNNFPNCYCNWVKQPKSARK